MTGKCVPVDVILQALYLEFLDVEKMFFFTDMSTVLLIKFFQMIFQGVQRLFMREIPDLTQRRIQFLPQRKDAAKQILLFLEGEIISAPDNLQLQRMDLPERFQ